MKRLSIRAGLGVMFAIAGLMASSAPAGASVPPEDVWVQVSPVVASNCAGVSGGDWAGLYMRDCDFRSINQFALDYVGWGYYGPQHALRNRASGKCVDGGPGPWNQVIQYSCNGTNAQVWYITSSAGGFVARSGRYPDYCAVSYANQVILAPCNGSSAQAWEWYYA